MRKKNKVRTWRNTCGPCFGAKVPEFQEITMKSLVDDDCILPYNFLRLFLGDKFIQNVSNMSSKYGCKVWCLATAEGELLACQPDAGLKTKIKNNGLGHGPDVVLSLSKQYGLKKGTKVACDNLFTSFDLLDHMGEHGWGVVGIVRQNRLVGVPMPTKKQAKKEMTRGTMKSVYDNNNCVTIWMDSKAEVLASNYTGPNPAGICERYSGKDKAYIKLSYVPVW
ncbi:uncharacterized protein LOC136087024 [Hydra vulgaris]|uniref:Uncharacterized protein LOC136087024 n=1 Tax=Hydra vulgaris TaxID=6087 RepID=A0ABM4CUJ7_HYDVU